MFKDRLALVLSVLVPATSANLGPGFDCLGLAIDLYLEVSADLSNEDHFYYKGDGQVADSADNLMHKSFRAAHQELGRVAPSVTFHVQNPIPLARGLGSSSAALVAGLVLADAFMDNALGRDGILQLAARMEGHPDNVAPAILGGFTASVFDGERYQSEALVLPESWQLLFGIPNFELLTSKAREVVPKTYPREDLIFNASRTALWSLAVIKDKPDLLKLASQDKVHEPYREPLVTGLAESKKRLLDAGAYAAFLSGAGPTLGVICSAELKANCQSILRDFVGEQGRVLEARSSKGYSFI